MWYLIRSPRTLEFSAGGELFVALAGDHYDGHDFIDEAKRSGAVAAMTSRPVDTDLPTLVVADTRRSLGQLASYWRGQFDIPMIAVTGSNGKTTVKEMMASILRGLGPSPGQCLMRGELDTNVNA